MQSIATQYGRQQLESVNVVPYNQGGVGEKAVISAVNLIRVGAIACELSYYANTAAPADFLQKHAGEKKFRVLAVDGLVCLLIPFPVLHEECGEIRCFLAIAGTTMMPYDVVVDAAVLPFYVDELRYTSATLLYELALKENFTKRSICVVGHSLGGYEALVFACMNDLHFIGYNSPATISTWFVSPKYNAAKLPDDPEFVATEQQWLYRHRYASDAPPDYVPKELLDAQRFWDHVFLVVTHRCNDVDFLKGITTSRDGALLTMFVRDFEDVVSDANLFTDEGVATMPKKAENLGTEVTDTTTSVFKRTQQLLSETRRTATKRAAELLSNPVPGFHPSTTLLLARNAAFSPTMRTMLAGLIQSTPWTIVPDNVLTVPNSLKYCLLRKDESKTATGSTSPAEPYGVKFVNSRLLQAYPKLMENKFCVFAYANFDYAKFIGQQVLSYVLPAGAPTGGALGTVAAAVGIPSGAATLASQLLSVIFGRWWNNNFAVYGEILGQHFITTMLEGINYGNVLSPATDGVNNTFRIDFLCYGWWEASKYTSLEERPVAAYLKDFPVYTKEILGTECPTDVLLRIFSGGQIPTLNTQFRISSDNIALNQRGGSPVRKRGIPDPYIGGENKSRR